MEPIPNYPTQTISILALIVPSLPFDVIIGNTTIHQWNLYPWLTDANSKQRAFTATPLARMLKRKNPPGPPTSEADTASVTSAFQQADWHRIDGTDYIDHDTDDCPPDTFPLSLAPEDLDAPQDTKPIAFARLTAANLSKLNTSEARLNEPQEYHDGDSMLDDITLFNPADDDSDTPHPQRRVGSSPYDDWATDPLTRSTSQDADDHRHRDKRQRHMTRKNWKPDEDDDASVASENFDTASPEDKSEFEQKFKPLIYPHLSDAEYNRVVKVLYRLRKRFSDKVHPKGAKIPPMDLRLRPNIEIPKQLRGRARKVAKIIDDEIHETCRKNILLGFVKEIHSADMYSQVLIVQRKTIGKDGETVTKSRFCIDYRHLNLITETYHFPLPLIDDLIRSLGGNCVFSSLDLTQGFHQCRLTPRAARLTAFMTSRGMYQYERVPFGLTGGPAYFQAMIQNHVLRGLVPDKCMVYIDDIIIFGRDHEEHARNLEEVLQRLGEYRVTIKPGKSLFCSPEVDYLGHTVNANGVSISRQRKTIHDQ